MTTTDNLDSIMIKNIDSDKDISKTLSKTLNNDSDKNKSESKNDSKDENMQHLQTSATDMMFQMLANQTKLVDEEKIMHFQKDEVKDEVKDETEHKHDDTKTENLDDFLTKSEDYPNLNPHAGKHGPSFGHGPGENDSHRKDKDKDEESESDEDLMLKKLNVLRQLGELAQKGVKLSDNYSMNSDYKRMVYELELHKSIRNKYIGVKWMSKLLVDVLWGVEHLNGSLNPFDIDLQGWSDQVNNDIDNYTDVLGELYEKYMKSGKSLPPELKLISMLGMSAIQFHVSKRIVGGFNLNNNITEQQRNELRRQAAAERNRKLNDTINKQHEQARKNVEDIDMLRKSKTQTQNINPNIFTKQSRLDQIQKQMNMHRSDSRSMYTNPKHNVNIQPTMRPPTLPSSLNKFTPNVNMQNFRQQNINQQKLQMAQNTTSANIQNLNPPNNSPTYHPNLDNILNENINTDMMSRVSSVSTLNQNDGNKSVNKNIYRRRKKTPPIVVNTSYE